MKKGISVKHDMFEFQDDKNIKKYTFEVVVMNHESKKDDIVFRRGDNVFDTKEGCRLAMQISFDEVNQNIKDQLKEQDVKFIHNYSKVQ